MPGGSSWKTRPPDQIKEASFAQKSALSLKLLQKLRNLSRNGANFASWGHVAAVRLQHQRLRMDELCESKSRQRVYHVVLHGGDDEDLCPHLFCRVIERTTVCDVLPDHGL